MVTRKNFKSLILAVLLYSGLSFCFAAAAQASSTLEIGRNADGRMEAFGIEKNKRSIYFRYQLAADGQWSDLIKTSLPNGRKVKQVEVARNANGTMELFAIAESGEVFYKYQTQPNRPMTAWQAFHFRAQSLEVGKHADGRLEVFAVEAGTLEVHHRWQSRPRTNASTRSSWGRWAKMGGKATKLAVAQNKDKRLELFAIDPNGQLKHRFQTGVNRPFSQWHTLGLNANDVAIGTHQDGRFEVFAVRKSDGRLLNRWQSAPNSPLVRNWNDLGLSVSTVNVESNTDGRMEIFAIDKRTQSVMRRHQVSPNRGLSNWQNTGLKATAIALSTNSPSGRMEAIAIDTAGRARHQFQRASHNSNSWNGTWHPMRNDNNVLLAGNANAAAPVSFTQREYIERLYISDRGGFGRGPETHGGAIDSTAYGDRRVQALVGGEVIDVKTGTNLSNVTSSRDAGTHPRLGRVKASLYNGTVVIYNRELDRTFTYLHFSDVSVKEGDRVNPGEILGTEGSTGWSTGRHTHLHIQKGRNGQRENPLFTLGVARAQDILNRKYK